MLHTLIAIGNGHCEEVRSRFGRIYVFIKARRNKFTFPLAFLFFPLKKNYNKKQRRDARRLVTDLQHCNGRRGLCCWRNTVNVQVQSDPMIWSMTIIKCNNWTQSAEIQICMNSILWKNIKNMYISTLIPSVQVHLWRSNLERWENLSSHGSGSPTKNGTHRERLGRGRVGQLYSFLLDDVGQHLNKTSVLYYALHSKGLHTVFRLLSIHYGGLPSSSTSMTRRRCTLWSV